MNTETLSILAAGLGLTITLTGFAIVVILKAINDSLFRINETLRSAVRLHPDHPDHFEDDTPAPPILGSITGGD